MTNVVLRAKARDVRTIASLLRPIAFSKICQVTISHAGMQVITELNGILQATAYIGRGMFDEFTFTPPPRRDETSSMTRNDSDEEEDDTPIDMFDVSLEMWLTTLNIYGTASGFTKEPGPGGGGGGADVMRRMPFGKGRSMMEMTYGGKGHPLQLDIHEGKVKTRCELATYETNTVVISEMPYLAERTVGQVIMQSKELTEALQSLDSTCRRVTFAFTDDSVRFDETTTTPRTPANRHEQYTAAGGGGGATLALSQTNHNVHSTAADRTDTRAAMRDGLGVEMMRISAVGDMGSTELDFPNRNKVFESFTFQYPSQHTYAYTNIQHCLRALQSSLKTSVRIDDQGMMSMQCLFPERPQLEREVDMDISGLERRGFVELRILPAFEEDL